MEVLWNLFSSIFSIGDLTMEIESDLVAFLANGLGKKLKILWKIELEFWLGNFDRSSEILAESFN